MRPLMSYKSSDGSVIVRLRRYSTKRCEVNDQHCRCLWSRRVCLEIIDEWVWGSSLSRQSRVLESEQRQSKARALAERCRPPRMPGLLVASLSLYGRYQVHTQSIDFVMRFYLPWGQVNAVLVNCGEEHNSTNMANIGSSESIAQSAALVSTHTL